MNEFEKQIKEIWTKKKDWNWTLYGSFGIDEFLIDQFYLLTHLLYGIFLERTEPIQSRLVLTDGLKIASSNCF